MTEPATATVWTPRGAWAGILPDDRFGAPDRSGVVVSPREGRGVASIVVAAGGEDALGRSVKTRFGLDLPATPMVSTSLRRSLVWAGPGQWLLLATSRQGFAEDVQALSGLAAIADQSDGRAALMLSGAAIRRALAKGCMLDLHPSAFPVGATASTSIAHVGVQLWRAADGPDGAVFEIMVPRSMAGSFWSWFSVSAAEFGGVIKTDRG